MISAGAETLHTVWGALAVYNVSSNNRHKNCHYFLNFLLKITLQRFLFLETFQAKLLIHRNKKFPESDGPLFYTCEAPQSIWWPILILGVLFCLLIFPQVYQISVKRLVKISGFNYFSFNYSPQIDALSLFLFKELEELYHTQKYMCWDTVTAASLWRLQLTCQSVPHLSSKLCWSPCSNLILSSGDGGIASYLGWKESEAQFQWIFCCIWSKCAIWHTFHIRLLICAITKPVNMHWIQNDSIFKIY